MTTVPAAYRSTQDLEAFLGDPFDGTSPCAFRDLVRCDEREELALAAVDRLVAWGYPAHLVPEPFGGSLRSMEELFALWRSVARRDLTLAVGYGATLLSAIPVWLWGDGGQRERVAELISAGRFGSFALSEADHGSDLAGNEVFARRWGDTFLLNGTKWPIGNATRGAFATVFAATGHGGYSVFLLDKENSPDSGWSTEPRVATTGLRGVDLSGLTFTRCALPLSALVGSTGRGLQIAHTTLQITRTLIAGVSLGAADTALRVALRHVRQRELYGRSVYEIPVIRDQLLDAYADLLVGECVGVAAARAATLAPERLSLWSSVAKYVVPELVDEVIAVTRTVLGARYFLREGVAEGVFQKLHRDHGIVGVFEGSSHVNLHVVASQLPAVLRGSADTGKLLAAIFARVDEAPAWDPARPGLRLTNSGLDEVSQCWPSAVADVEALCWTGAATPVQQALLIAVRQVDQLWAELSTAVAELVRDNGNLHTSARGFALARRYCLLHAAAACVHTWLANRRDLDDHHAAGEWLVLCLRRLLGRMLPDQAWSDEHSAPVEQRMLRCLDENLLFSLIPVELGS